MYILNIVKYICNYIVVIDKKGLLKQILYKVYGSSKILTTVITIDITAHTQCMRRYELTAPSIVGELFAVGRIAVIHWITVR